MKGCLVHYHEESNFAKCIKAMQRCSLDKTQLAKREMSPSVRNRAECKVVGKEGSKRRSQKSSHCKL